MANGHIPQGPQEGRHRDRDYTGKTRGWYSLRHPRFTKYKGWKPKKQKESQSEE